MKILNHKSRSLFVLSFLMTTFSSLQAADLKTTAVAVSDKFQKAVVTVKLVLKMRMQQQEQEQKLEVVGTMIDPSGLTLVSASSVDPMTALNAILGSLGGANKFKVDSDVAETKIILDDGTEIDADVVLKDPDLDFAFVRPRISNRTFDFVPLKPREIPLQMLDEVFTLGRLGRTENRAISLNESAIKSIVKGPRTYYVCDERISSNLGSVVFASDGLTAGVLVTKQSQSNADRGGGAMLSMMRLSGQSLSLPMTILRPVEDVLEILPQAKEAKVPEKKEPKPETPKSEPVKSSDTKGSETGNKEPAKAPEAGENKTKSSGEK